MTPSTAQSLLQAFARMSATHPTTAAEILQQAAQAGPKAYTEAEVRLMLAGAKLDGPCDTRRHYEIPHGHTERCETCCHFYPDNYEAKT